MSFYNLDIELSTLMGIKGLSTSDKFCFSIIDEPQVKVENGPTDVYHRPSYMMARESSKEQSIQHAHKTLERQKSLDTNQLHHDNLTHTSRDSGTEKRRYSTSDESEDSTMYQTQQEDFLPEGLSNSSSQRQFSQDVDNERDVDMPYVIGQFKLENKCYRKPFFLNRASTFCAKNPENTLKMKRKSNLKRALSSSSFLSRSLSNPCSVIYEEVVL